VGTVLYVKPAAVFCIVMPGSAAAFCTVCYPDQHMKYVRLLSDSGSQTNADLCGSELGSEF
jgi:hypothetical protein